MSAYEVCDNLVNAIKSGEYDVIIINFANPDMVGHTGVEAAAIKAVEAVDECVGKAVDAIKEVDGGCRRFSFQHSEQNVLFLFMCISHCYLIRRDFPVISAESTESWSIHPRMLRLMI